MQCWTTTMCLPKTTVIAALVAGTTRAAARPVSRQSSVVQTQGCQWPCKDWEYVKQQDSTLFSTGTVLHLQRNMVSGATSGTPHSQQQCPATIFQAIFMLWHMRPARLPCFLHLAPSHSKRAGWHLHMHTHPGCTLNRAFAEHGPLSLHASPFRDDQDQVDFKRHGLWASVWSMASFLVAPIQATTPHPSSVATHNLQYRTHVVVEIHVYDTLVLMTQFKVTFYYLYLTSNFDRILTSFSKDTTCSCLCFTPSTFLRNV